MKRFAMQNLRKYRNHSPLLGERVYVDACATVIGCVKLGDDSSVWPRTVIRGDVNRVEIGARSNIQDGCIIHVSRPTPGLPQGWPTLLDDEVTIGHGVILHGCKISSRVLVGNAAVVMDGAEINENVIVGACALVPPGKKLASGFLYIGSPCKQARRLTDAEMAGLAVSADNYVRLKDEYLTQE